jgi:hypothetical protein
VSFDARQFNRTIRALKGSAATPLPRLMMPNGDRVFAYVTDDPEPRYQVTIELEEAWPEELHFGNPDHELVNLRVSINDTDVFDAKNPPRYDLIVNRDPDGDTTCTLFVNGVQVDSFNQHDIDPGRSGSGCDWFLEQLAPGWDADMPPAVADAYQAQVESVHDYTYHDDDCLGAIENKEN